MPLFTVKTTANREIAVADDILEFDYTGIYAAVAPEEVQNYLFVEAESYDAVVEVVKDTPNAQKVLQGETSMGEVEHFLNPGSDVDDIREGDTVEITSGPYEGDTATITSINKATEHVTLELTESPVPIPIELRGDQVRVLDAEAY